MHRETSDDNTGCQGTGFIIIVIDQHMGEQIVFDPISLICDCQ